MENKLWQPLHLKSSIMFVSLRLLALVFMVSIASLSVTSSVNAASEYDDTINMTDAMNFGPVPAFNNCTADMTETWSEPIHNRAEWPSNLSGNENFMMEIIRTSYMETIFHPDGKWGVTRDYTNDYFGDRYRVWWTTSEVTFEWLPWTTGVNVLIVSPVNYVDIGVYKNDNGTCKYSVSNSEWWTSSGVRIARGGVSGHPERPFFITGATVPYPPGYEGEVIPGGPPGSNAPSEYQPDLNVLIVSGFRAVIQDKNFNTFDDPPFTCNDGTAPVMYYELFRNESGGNVKIDSGVMSPTIQYVKELEFTEQNYTFLGWYSCGELPELQFDKITFLSFEVNQYGTQVIQCSDDIDGFFCKLSQSMNIGIFSATFNGFSNTLQVFSRINPSFCNTNWTSTANFESDIIPVQQMPGEVCSFATAYYLPPTSPFHTFTVWVNVLMSGAAILLFVFGLLSILGFKVRLGTPLEDEAGDPTSSRPDIKTSSSITRHRGAYVKGPGSGKNNPRLGG